MQGFYSTLTSAKSFMAKQIFSTFWEFYPFYLAEHANLYCRRMHFLGSILVLTCVAVGLITQYWWLFAWALCLGYGCAWIGHFVFEKNHPATFRYPWYSFMGDWVMFVDMLRGRVRF